MSANLPEKNLNWKMESRSGDMYSKKDHVSNEVDQLRVNFCRHLFPFLQIKMLCKVPFVLEFKKKFTEY